MEKAPAFQVYTKDFDTDEKVMLMTLEQEGAYFRLLRVQWREGSIPADHGALAMLCRVTARRFTQAVWPGISGCFIATGVRGRLANARMERERSKQDAFRRERAESGRKGGKRSRGPSSASGSASSSGEAEVKPAVCCLLFPVCNCNGEQQTSTDLSPAGERATWVTPYEQAWRTRWGAESKPPTGELLSHMAGPRRLLGEAESLARWVRFLAAAEMSQRARPHRFAEGLGEWARAKAPAARGPETLEQIEAGIKRQDAEREAANANRQPLAAPLPRRGDGSIDVQAVARRVRDEQIAAGLEQPA